MFFRGPEYSPLLQTLWVTSKSRSRPPRYSPTWCRGQSRDDLHWPCSSSFFPPAQTLRSGKKQETVTAPGLATPPPTPDRSDSWSSTSRGRDLPPPAGQALAGGRRQVHCRHREHPPVQPLPVDGVQVGRSRPRCGPPLNSGRTPSGRRVTSLSPGWSGSTSSSPTPSGRWR